MELVLIFGWDVSLKSANDNGQEENKAEILKLIWPKIKEDIKRLTEMEM
jgi:hypothetical protein